MSLRQFYENLNLQVLYEKMTTIRLLEDRLQRYCDDGRAGDLHFNKGQEAIAVGVCAALRLTDKIVTHHRTIAHQVAMGAPLRPLVAELLGRATGTNGGRAGEMHISDPAIGHDFSFQLVGTCIPVGAGLAWALKNYKKTDDVVAIFFGDAAASNGQFHEGLNLIAIHRLPVLLVCENNHRAGNILPQHYAPPLVDGQGTRGPSMLALNYGIPSLQVDGNDVEGVMDNAADLIETIRLRGEPWMLECHTDRNCWHKQGQRDVRTKEELAEVAKRDPLLRAPDHVSVDVDAINKTLDEVFAQAESDPFPAY